jgi:hypothetical protein
VIIAIIVACIGGAAAIVAALIGVFNKSKLAEIHVLVNNRLDEALKEISDLKKAADQK